MSDDNYDIMFSKLKLQVGDSLVIKVNTDGLSEDLAVEKLKQISEDPFIDYLKNKGHTIFISYTGIDISILRLNEDDKVLVGVDISGMDEETAKRYVNFVEFKLSSNISKDRLVIVPKSGNTELNVLVNKENK